MSSNNNIPQLRFPGFTGEWEEKPLGEVFTFRNGYTPSKNNSQFWDGGTLPWFRLEDIRENGNILYDSIQHVSKKAIKGTGAFKANSIIVSTSATIGEHALIKVNHLANQRFVNLYPDEKYVKKIDIMYAFYYMFIIDNICKSNINIGTFASVNMTSFSQIPFPIPYNIKEQYKIAECLSEMDNLISAQGQKVEALKEKKRGMMQQMFPQQGETTPRLRFPGFTGEWDYVNGDKLFEPISNKNHHSDLPILALTQDHGAVPRDMINYNVFVSDKSVANYKVVEVDDFIISLRSFQGGIEYSHYKGLCSPAYIVLRKRSNELNSDFYRIYFKTFIYIQELNKNLEGIRDGKMISYKQFSEIKLPMPSSSEQQKIAECLSAMDDMIASESAKLDALKDLKKGLMQQLFPQLNK